ncbi:MAG TPA: hypothetical protein DD379_27030 [Cyanobacteria bacterium UBA11162]|nr:hypothetical protein [Cyanobacteria bacterium UBA11162]
MNLFERSHKILTALALVLVLTITTSCAAPSQTSRTNAPTGANSSVNYAQLERGNSSAGQEFGDWVVQTAQGLVSDAYVRDNNKLGVVITPQVRPNEVQPLAKSLVQGFRQNFPNQDLKVLMYAPDKQLILTANYDHQSNQVSYQ